MSKNNEFELSESAKELIEICSGIEDILKSKGYVKVESEPGCGEYKSDLYDTEEPSFRLCTKGKYPILFDCYQDLDKPFAFYEVKSLLKDRDFRPVDNMIWQNMLKEELAISNKKEIPMAEKKQNTQSAEDRALEKFTELMVEKIQNIQTDWKKPWFTPGAAQMPKNLSGRQYNGMNSIILMLQQEKSGWTSGRYATFDRLTGLNFTQNKQGARVPATDNDGNKLPQVSINKGEKSTPVFLTTFTVVNPETKERMRYDDYKQMSEEERAKWNIYPKLQVYNVFNIDQSNLKEARPELYEKLVSESKGEIRQSTEGMMEFPAIDAMIDKNLWYCPIKPTKGDDAYFSISKDEIIVPLKEQFVDGESFYSNLFHEMTHSTGAESRLNRIKPASFGSREYSREELVAELTAALVSSQHGIEKHVKDDSAAYLKSWLDSLKEDPSFIKSALMDVKRASSIINNRIDAVNLKLEQGEKADYSDIHEQNRNFSAGFSMSNKANLPEEPKEQQQHEEQKPAQAAEEAAKQIQHTSMHR